MLAKIYKVDGYDAAKGAPESYVPRESRGPESMTGGAPQPLSYETIHQG